MTTPEQNKETALRFGEEVFNNKNLAVAEEILSEDFVEHDVLPGMTPDKKGALQWFAQMMQMVPDMHSEIRHIVASGDRVAIHSTFSGTDAGGMVPGVPPTGKSFEADSMDILRFDDDGKCAEHWGIQDQMSMMIQLGLVQPPGM
jgi:steroid delta-isomerase-like uncharacterized protein